MKTGLGKFSQLLASLSEAYLEGMKTPGLYTVKFYFNMSEAYLEGMKTFFSCSL